MLLNSVPVVPRKVLQTALKNFSVAYNIRDKFETAWLDRQGDKAGPTK